MYRNARHLNSLERRGLLYLHIPKTAGSSINDVLGSQFHENEVATHIESKKLLGVIDPGEVAKKYRYLSGHVTYPQCRNQLELNDWITFATFRKPDEHVASHIAWVRLLAEKGHEGRLKQHNETIQEIAHYIKELDLSSPNSIQSMIQWLEDNNYLLFHNVQTRYLCGGKAELTTAPHQIHNALKNLESLDYVGITERLDEFILMLSAIFGFTITADPARKKNTNNHKFGMDLADMGFRSAIEPLIEYDHIIYTAARRRFIDNLHELLAALEKSQFPRFSSVNLDIVRRLLVNDDRF